MNTQIQHNSKSLFTSLNLGYDIEQEEIMISNSILYKENPKIKSQINTGFDRQETTEQIPIILQINQDNPVQLSKDSILDSANSGFGQYNQIHIEYIKPELEIPEIQEIIPPKIIIQQEKPKDVKDSILDNVDSGYGLKNEIVVECAKPTYKTHIFKENFLGEFKTKIEKQKARDNLNVYSKGEVDEIVKSFSSNVITHEQLDEKLANLDFTSSKLKSHASYEIPNNLFK